jgi:hypothetical protein
LQTPPGTASGLFLWTALRRRAFANTACPQPDVTRSRTPPSRYCSSAPSYVPVVKNHCICPVVPAFVLVCKFK